MKALGKIFLLTALINLLGHSVVAHHHHESQEAFCPAESGRDLRSLIVAYFTPDLGGQHLETFAADGGPTLCCLPPLQDIPFYHPFHHQNIPARQDPCLLSPLFAWLNRGPPVKC